MSADDIRWGRGGGHQVPKGVRAGEGVADLEQLRRDLGGSLLPQPAPAEDDPQLSLFGEGDE